MLNRKNFNVSFLGLMINYNYTPKYQKETIDLYYQQLSNVYNLTDVDLNKAINYLLANSSTIFGKFPKVEDFLIGAGKSPNQLAEKAWNLLINKYIPIKGRYNSFSIGQSRRHLALYETIDFFGGWHKFSSLSSIELNQIEKKFKEKFKELYCNGNFKKENYFKGIIEIKEKFNNLPKIINYNN